MFCAKCGHNNPSTASKCVSCGLDMGPNEAVEMFQKQAQTAKGIAVSGFDFSQPGEYSLGGGLAHAQEAQAVADDFFGELSSPPPVVPPVARLEKKGPDESFFAKGGSHEEPVFETDIKSLTVPEDELPPEEHPLFSPPTNPHIEGYIARRAAARGKH